MRRSYRADRFLGILDRVHARIPNAAITTDIIVGFPGETEEDFAQTLRVVEQARFASAFTFQYSVRPGTPAASMPDQVPKVVVQERYERLMALQDRLCLEENQAQVGRRVEVLIAHGEGKKDSATDRITGRAEDSRLVHVAVPPGVERPRPGDVVTATITHAAPFHLLADSTDTLVVRRTRAGDAWDRAQAASCGAPSPARLGAGSGAEAVSGAETGAAPARVSLGLPTLRVATTPLYDLNDGERLTS